MAVTGTLLPGRRIRSDAKIVGVIPGVTIRAARGKPRMGLDKRLVGKSGLPRADRRLFVDCLRTGSWQLPRN